MLKSTLKDTAKNIQRNNLMSFASVVSIVAALIILGAFIIITININNIANTMVASLELKVFLNDNISESDLNIVENYFEENELITGYVFESKNDTLDRYAEKLEDYSGLLDGFDYTNNPIADSYTVSVISPQDLETVKTEIEELPTNAVNYVRYAEEYIDAIVLFKNVSNYACLIILIILSIISIVVIYNTIKLTCYSNRKEIEIMRIVGADDWYIKLPFFLEGLVLGIFGAFMATLLLATVYTYLIGLTDTLAYLPLDSHLVAPHYVLIPIFIFSIIYGIIMGAFGSLFSIRRYFVA